MAWTISYTSTAERQLKKLDKQISRQIIDFLDKRIATLKDPRSTGKPLTGPLGSLWRYRTGDYRIICEIRDKELVVLVIRLGHRKEVYE